MTHRIEKRNADAKIKRPNAERLTRLIGLLSRHWVDAAFVADDMNDDRLTISKGYLVNVLGLTMFVEQRLADGRRPIQIHHLPKQDRAVIELAIKLLTPNEHAHGVAVALRALVYQHPFSNGDLPPKLGYTREEADRLGMVKESVAGDGRSMKDVAFEMLTKEWLTVRDWSKFSKSSRLSYLVEEMNIDLAKLDPPRKIAREMKVNASGSKRPYASYHYCEDPAEHAAWAELMEERAAQQLQYEREAEDEKLDAEAKAKEARDAKILANVAKRSHLGGGSRYGGWKGTPQTPLSAVDPAAADAAARKVVPLFRAADVVQVPRPVPANVAGRLQGLQTRVLPKTEIESAPDVPAEKLNIAFPQAGSREVVELDGRRYVRRYLPVKEGNTVREWQTRWEAQD
jgi:hypothetical protein